MGDGARTAHGADKMFSRALKTAKATLLNKLVAVRARIGPSVSKRVQRGIASGTNGEPSAPTVRRPRYPSCIGKYAWQLDEITTPAPVNQ
jgi:hypothetical protein